MSSDESIGFGSAEMTGFTCLTWGKEDSGAQRQEKVAKGFSGSDK